MRWFLLVATMLLAAPAAAAIYHCMDAAGRDVYADRPCDRGDPIRLEPPAAIADAPRPSARRAAARLRVRLRIQRHARARRVARRRVQARREQRRRTERCNRARAALDAIHAQRRAGYSVRQMARLTLREQQQVQRQATNC